MPNRPTAAAMLREDLAGFAANMLDCTCDQIVYYEPENLSHAVGFCKLLRESDLVASRIEDRVAMRMDTIEQSDHYISKSKRANILIADTVSDQCLTLDEMRERLRDCDRHHIEPISFLTNFQTLRDDAGTLSLRIADFKMGRAYKVPTSLVTSLWKRREAQEKYLWSQSAYLKSYDPARPRARRAKPSPPPASAWDSIQLTYIELLAIIRDLQQPVAGTHITPARCRVDHDPRSAGFPPADSGNKVAPTVPRDEGREGFVQRSMREDQAEPEQPIPLAMDSDPHHGRSSDSAPADSGNKDSANLVREVTRPDLVTLDQAARIVHKTKRTLERRKTKGDLPEPVVEGGGGLTALYAWHTMRPWLEKNFNIKLPDTFPANRDRTDT